MIDDAGFVDGRDQQPCRLWIPTDNSFVPFSSSGCQKLNLTLSFPHKSRLQDNDLQRR